MGFTLDSKYAAIEPSELYQQCRADGLRTDHFWGICNHFRTGLTKPGTGKILLLRETLDLLRVDSGNDAFHTLTISDNIKGNSVTLKKVLLVGHEVAGTPGWEADPNTAYVVELADPRWLHWDRGITVTKAYNLRTDADGSLVTDTLNAGVAWTWQQIITDLWPSGLGTAPTLPFTPDGTPESFWFIDEYPLRAVMHILRRLACGIQYDPVNDTYAIVRLGDLTAANAADALELEITYRDFLRYDGYAVTSRAAQYPQKLRVEFRVRAPYTNGTLPYYTSDQTVTPAASSTNTAYLVLEDELTAISDGVTVSNAAALSTRAIERASHWTAKRTYHDTAVYREYNTIADLTPALGCYFAEVAWEERGRGAITSIAAGVNDPLNPTNLEAWKRQPYTDPVGQGGAMWAAKLIRTGGQSGAIACCCCDPPPKPAPIPQPGGAPLPKPEPAGGGGSSMTTVPPPIGPPSSMTTGNGGIIPDTFPASTATDRGIGTQQICQWTYQTGIGYVNSCFDYPRPGRNWPGGGSGNDIPLGGGGIRPRGMGFMGSQGFGLGGGSALLSIYGVDNPSTAGKVLTSNGATSTPTYQDPAAPVANASADLTGQTSSITVATYTPGADGTYALNAYVVVTTSGGSNLAVKANWTDETSTARTATLISSPATINATGAYIINGLTLRAKGSNAISITTTVGIGGGITYDIGGDITKLRS